MYQCTTIAKKKKTLNQIQDAAVVIGMILLNEAHNIKGDAGKKRSKLSYVFVYKCLFAEYVKY